jgi:hypothetical protein
MAPARPDGRREMSQSKYYLRVHLLLKESHDQCSNTRTIRIIGRMPHVEYVQFQVRLSTSVKKVTHTVTTF